MMEILFLILIFLCIYPYFLYPLLITLLSKLFAADWQRGDSKQSISVIISVFNEEGVIREKIENSLKLHYPEELLEIIVVSDGSTDRTNQIASSYSDPRVRLEAFPGRKGKTACLNQVVPLAKGDIIVFTDANSMFPPDALLKFSRNFNSEQVGLVTGWTKYRKPGGDEESVGLYGRLEMITKKSESLVSSCVGADGAIFAIRKHLFQPLEDYDINDFVIPLNVIGQGKRVVLDSGLYCVEEPGDNESKEFSRQVRITNRTLGAIWRNIHFLNPIAYGSFSFFLLSHKVIRFLVPFTFLGTFMTAMLLANVSILFTLFAIAQALFICIGIAGILKLSNGRLTQLCSFFLLTIAAQLVGWIRWATGKADVMWTPIR
jgi:cellulose synthase/poly-beta-1,6-N-acetylglucosamine synthase-like glycosyltransferase